MPGFKPTCQSLSVYTSVIRPCNFRHRRLFPTPFRNFKNNNIFLIPFAATLVCFHKMLATLRLVQALGSLIPTLRAQNKNKIKFFFKSPFPGRDVLGYVCGFFPKRESLVAVTGWCRKVQSESLRERRLFEWDKVVYDVCTMCVRLVALGPPWCGHLAVFALSPPVLKLCLLPDCYRPGHGGQSSAVICCPTKRKHFR